MRIPSLKAENVQSLRRLVKQVPVELRDTARGERKRLIQMDKEIEGSSAYAVARGALNANARLAEFVDKLKSKSAVDFYQRQPVGKVVNPVPVAQEKRALQYVSASMAEDTANSQLAHDYLANKLLK